MAVAKPRLTAIGIHQRLQSCGLFFPSTSISHYSFLSFFQARGSQAGSTGVNDTVVNQLLSKIDGVNQVGQRSHLKPNDFIVTWQGESYFFQLNNILIIGMTNRRDMIDEALLRPGRLEVSIEIGLPKEKGTIFWTHIWLQAKSLSR